MALGIPETHLFQNELKKNLCWHSLVPRQGFWLAVLGPMQSPHPLTAARICRCNWPSLGQLSFSRAGHVQGGGFYKKTVVST